ncbi:MAG: SDR family oxidoreductase [Acidobacteria bacterium]|nr:SDR family oxidoreductase [Acidobacteriota bacterium]
MASLEGHRAIVTGSSRNLGAEIANHLALAGALVCVNYHHSREQAEEVVAALRDVSSGRHVAVQGDVADPGEVERIVSESAGSLGGVIDILVNNAGPYDATPFLDLEVKDFDRVWNVNTKSTYLMMRAVAPAMRRQEWGRVVNISASSAFVRNRSIYTLANAAIITLTEAMAMELGPEVTVNAIAPGQISESLEELKDHIPEWADQVVKATPRGLLATRKEIADLVVLLCGPVFASVTGITIPIDGGLHLNTF